MSKQSQYSGPQGKRIDNHVEVTHALARHKFMKSDGSYIRAKVDNPNFNNKAPRYLRVRVAREGMNFKLIREAKELGLEIGDVFQLTKDHSEEKICIRFDSAEE